MLRCFMVSPGFFLWNLSRGVLSLASLVAQPGFSKNPAWSDRFHGLCFAILLILQNFIAISSQEARIPYINGTRNLFIGRLGMNDKERKSKVLMMNQEKTEFLIRKYSTREKVIWGMAGFGMNLISGVYGALLQYFYQTYLGVSSFLIGIAAWLYAIWNAVNDPIFGFISDSTKNKNGRRIPYMRFTAPFLGLTFILVWLVPTNLPEIGLFWWMLVTMLLYDTAYTIIGLVYSALLPELTESDLERGELQKYSSIFSLLGMILGFILPDLVRPKTGFTSLGTLYVGIVAIGISGAACVFLTSFYIKERPEFTIVDKPLNLKESFKFTMTSKSFIILVSANFMSILVQAIVIGSIYYLADYVIQTSTIYLLAMVFIGLIVGVFFANSVAARFGVVNANRVLLTVSGIPLILLAFVPDIYVLPLLIFAGFGLSGPLVLTNVLFAQVADEDEIKSGVRREAAFFGINALITKPAQSLALFLGSFLIESSGFIPADPVTGEIELDQPLSVILAIKILIGLIPGLAMLSGALILTLYPLKGAYLANVQEKIITLHAEKSKLLKKQKNDEGQARKKDIPS
ncbi:MAG: MFS transporter [Promethearchaeota archaeon]